MVASKLLDIAPGKCHESSSLVYTIQYFKTEFFINTVYEKRVSIYKDVQLAHHMTALCNYVIVNDTVRIVFQYLIHVYINLFFKK